MLASVPLTWPQDWKRVLLADVVKAGGSALLKPYGNSVFAALVDTFPEKEWDEFTVRPHVSRGYWDEVANRRAFLERFVRDWKAKRGEREEPTLPLGSKELWREVDVADICSSRGGATFMKHYHFSLARALKELLPAQDVCPAQLSRLLHAVYVLSCIVPDICSGILKRCSHGCRRTTGERRRM